MKKRYGFMCFSSVALLGITSCDKPDTAGGSAPEKVIEAIEETVVEAVSPEVSASLSDEERAAKVGFAKYLPKDADAFITVYNAEKAAEQLKALKLYGLIETGLGSGMMFDDELDLEIEAVPEEELLEDEPLEAPDAEQEFGDEMEDDGLAAGGVTSPWDLLGQEVTIAYGATSSEQLGNLLTLGRRLTFYQAKALVEIGESFTRGEDSTVAPMALSAGMMGTYLQLLADPESGVDLFDKMALPPLYIALRAKDGEIDQAAEMLNQMMGVFTAVGPMAEPVSFETGGGSFAGYKVVGEKLAQQMEASRGGMDVMVGSETVSRIIASVRGKDLIMVTGSVGDYAVVMIGDDTESMKLASGFDDSLVSTGELNFVDSAADKQLVTLAYGERKMWEEMIEQSGGLSAYALGIRDGLASSEAMGDTRDIQEMLLLVADREEALLGLSSYEDFGMMAFVDEGLKIETFGGIDNGSLAWDESTEMASLGNDKGNLLFWNSVSTAEYGEAAGEYAEAIFETAYAIVIKLSGMELPQGDLTQAKGYAALFDNQFRGDVVGLYAAMSGDLAEGLGNESALIVDLEGAIPAAPVVPKAILENGTMPRVTLVKPVEDRSKVAAAWTEMNGRASSLLEKIGVMTEKRIPMQKPLSSETDGMKTWYFSLPFLEEDFMPSVTLNDEWFAVSSSKLHATDMIRKAAAGGDAGKGMKMYVNFSALTAYANGMLDMVEENSAEIFPTESSLGNFNRDKAEIREVLDAVSQFESLSWTAKKEDGYMHNSLHFRTKP